MKRLLAIFVTAMLPVVAMSQTWNVELKNIRYYASTKCGEENPVLVKVCFSAKNLSPSELSYVVMESNQRITYTGRVTETDKDGNIYYSFCTKDGETNSFEIFFRDADGVRSRIFSIFAKPE
ncbi:MAG: hypothetical protein J6X05_00965 [Bacteroidales bacterium]|nr:hypothetical protein [Bacteroidales bacterium]